MGNKILLLKIFKSYFQNIFFENVWQQAKASVTCESETVTSDGCQKYNHKEVVVMGFVSSVSH